MIKGLRKMVINFNKILISNLKKTTRKTPRRPIKNPQNEEKSAHIGPWFKILSNDLKIREN